MHPVETEVKFHVADPVDMRSRLLGDRRPQFRACAGTHIRFEDQSRKPAPEQVPPKAASGPQIHPDL